MPGISKLGIFKIIKFFNNLSLKYKITIVNSLLAISFLVVSVASFSVYNNRLIENSEKSVQQLQDQMAKKLDIYLNDIINATMIPLYNQDLLHALEFEQDKEFFTSGLNKEVDTMLYSTVFAKNEVHSVILFDLNRMRFSKLKKGALINFEELKKQQWYEKALDDKSKVAITDVYSLSNVTNETEDERKIFTVARQIFSVNLSKPVGFILINTKLDFLRQLCSEVQITNSQRVIITNNNTIIYDTKEKNGGNTIGDEQILKLVENEGKNYYTGTDGIKYLVCSSASKIPVWKIISTVPVSDITSEINTAKVRILMINITICVIMLLGTLAFSIKLVSPIKKLVLLMRLVREGNMNVRYKIRGIDEIGELGIGFNKMIEHLQNLIEQVYQTKLRYKEAELHALQNQINPHFLYNTLESIHMITEINDDHEASQMIQVLGDILRYSVSLKKQKVKVAEEIEHLHKYLFIQNVRFEHKFEVEFDIDESLLDKEIIKLILQPLVENAIYHGLETVDNKGKIVIRGYENESNIVFQIHDNGIGIDEARLEQLNKDACSPESEGRSIGIRNVSERIKIHYGEQYGLSIFSEKGKGTIVKVFLPSTDRKAEDHSLANREDN